MERIKNKIRTMKQITLPTMTNERWLILGLSVFLIFTMFTCNNTDVSLAKSEAKRELINKNANEKIASLAIQIVDNNKEREISKSKTNSLIKEIWSLKTEKIEINKKYIAVREKVKSFTNTEKTNYIANRYSAPNEVKTTQNGIELSNNVTDVIINDLVGLDELTEVHQNTEKELFKTQNIVMEKDNQISLGLKNEKQLSLMLTEKDVIINADSEYIKQQEKVIKKATLNKNIYKGATAIFVLTTIVSLLKN